jgi:hypothetical protein
MTNLRKYEDLTLAQRERLAELIDAWRTSRRELIAGRLDSITAVRERRIILRQAEDEGLLDEMMTRVTNSRGLNR